MCISIFNLSLKKPTTNQTKNNRNNRNNISFFPSVRTKIYFLILIWPRQFIIIITIVIIISCILFLSESKVSDNWKHVGSILWISYEKAIKKRSKYYCLQCIRKLVTTVFRLNTWELKKKKNGAGCRKKCFLVVISDGLQSRLPRHESYCMTFLKQCKALKSRA